MLQQTILSAALGCTTLHNLTPRELDGVVRGLSRALAEHELELCKLILAMHRADGYRRLGYATDAHYARERLGMSRSSLLARRALALRLESLPGIAEALSKAQVGVEAALQIVRIATPNTEHAWVGRARQRTIKHLREEVDAALTAVRISGQLDCPPPGDAEIDAFHDLERAASSGRIFEPTNHVANDQPPSSGTEHTTPEEIEQNAWWLTLDSLAKWLARGVQMCAGHGTTTSAASVQMCAGPPSSSGASHATRHKGRVTFRLRITRETYGFWRNLEKQARRWLPPGISWLRFCCLSLWRAWRHLLNRNVAYGHIYLRDRHRCTSPVCTRRDVTPHHIKFRSAGGSDDDENVTTVCTWCHLLGIHGGRIRAQGRAQHIRWELGRRGATCLVVDGRQRQAA